MPLGASTLRLWCASTISTSKALAQNLGGLLAQVAEQRHAHAHVGGTEYGDLPARPGPPRCFLLRRIAGGGQIPREDWFFTAYAQQGGPTLPGWEKSITTAPLQPAGASESSRMVRERQQSRLELRPPRPAISMPSADRLCGDGTAHVAQCATDEYLHGENHLSQHNQPHITHDFLQARAALRAAWAPAAGAQRPRAGPRMRHGGLYRNGAGFTEERGIQRLQAPAAAGPPPPQSPRRGRRRQRRHRLRGSKVGGHGNHTLKAAGHQGPRSARHCRSRKPRPPRTGAAFPCACPTSGFASFTAMTFSWRQMACSVAGAMFMPRAGGHVVDHHGQGAARRQWRGSGQSALPGWSCCNKELRTAARRRRMSRAQPSFFDDLAGVVAAGTGDHGNTGHGAFCATRRMTAMRSSRVMVAGSPVVPTGTRQCTPQAS